MTPTISLPLLPPISCYGPTTARCCLHTLWMGHHLWQSRRPASRAPAERQSEKGGVCTGVGVGVGVRGEGENLEVRRGWCPRIWCHQAPDEKARQREAQLGRATRKGPPASHHFRCSLPSWLLPFHPSLLPTPSLSAFSHLLIFEHPAFRSRDRTPQRSALGTLALPSPGPSPARPSPLRVSPRRAG